MALELLSCATRKLPENSSRTNHPFFIEISPFTRVGWQRGCNGCIKFCSKLLDVSFLIVKLLPLPVAFHPEFRDIDSGKMHDRSGWKLQSDFIDDEGCIRTQRNEFEAPHCVVENVAILQFTEGLDFGTLTLSVDFDALVIVR